MTKSAIRKAVEAGKKFLDEEAAQMGGVGTLYAVYGFMFRNKYYSAEFSERSSSLLSSSSSPSYQELVRLLSRHHQKHPSMVSPAETGMQVIHQTRTQISSNRQPEQLCGVQPQAC
jgi:hypothetical protein